MVHDLDKLSHTLLLFKAKGSRGLLLLLSKLNMLLEVLSK